MNEPHMKLAPWQQGLADMSPVLLAMSQNLSGGQSPFMNLGPAYQAMDARKQKREQVRLQKEAKELEAAFLGGGNVAGVAAPLSPAKQVAQDTMSALGVSPEWLVKSESGGKFGAQNNVPGAGGTGHFGRVQFSRARLDEAKAAGAIPSDITPEQFLSDPTAQQRAERWHFADIRRHIAQKGYADQGFDVEGLVGVAHLGGKAGMDRFVATQGGYNPSDANGTSLMDYYKRGSAGQQQPASAPGRLAGASRERLIALVQHPAVSPEIKQMAMAELRPQGGPDERTTLQKNYEAARAQGYSGSIIDYQKATRAGNVTNVNALPPLSKDYRYVYDDDGKVVGSEPVPGTKAAREQNQESRSLQLATADYERKFQVVDQSIDRAVDMLDAHGRSVAGFGSWLSVVPETKARDFQALIDNIKSNLGFEELQAMREASPTGGALGSVTERELAFLQATQGSLDTAQSPERLKEILRDIKVRRAQFADERRRIMQETGVSPVQAPLDDDDLLERWQ